MSRKVGKSTMKDHVQGTLIKQTKVIDVKATFLS